MTDIVESRFKEHRLLGLSPRNDTKQAAVDGRLSVAEHIVNIEAIEHNIIRHISVVNILVTVAGTDTNCM